MEDNKDKPYCIHGIYYRFHPSDGYSEAKKWLKEIGEWDYVSTHGFSTDGWSIVATANDMCEKVTYKTFYEAIRAVNGFYNGRSYTNRRFATKKPKRAYKCNFCGKYHITSQKKKY